MQPWAQPAVMSDNAVPKPSMFAIGERVSGTKCEDDYGGRTFGYRLEGLARRHAGGRHGNEYRLAATRKARVLPFRTA
jgi:hypothetical protein